MAPLSHDRLIKIGIYSLLFAILAAFAVLFPASGRAQVIDCATNSSSNLRDLVALAEHLKTFAQSDDMVAIFEHGLSCADRIWKTKNTRLGTLPTYFYDSRTNTACLWKKGKGCKPDPKVLRNPSFQNAISDLVGYSTFNPIIGKGEVLILNKSVSDFTQKAKQENQNRIDVSPNEFEERNEELKKLGAPRPTLKL